MVDYVFNTTGSLDARKMTPEKIIEALKMATQDVKLICCVDSSKVTIALDTKSSEIEMCVARSAFKKQDLNATLEIYNTFNNLHKLVLDKNDKPLKFNPDLDNLELVIRPEADGYRYSMSAHGQLFEGKRLWQVLARNHDDVLDFGFVVGCFFEAFRNFPLIATSEGKRIYKADLSF